MTTQKSFDFHIFLLLFVFSLFVNKVLAEQSECSFKIGAALPLTGSMAQAGAEIRNGLLLGLQDLPQERRAKIKLIFEDTAYSQTRTATVATKLISQDHVNAIITVWDSSEIVAPITEKSGVITFAYRWNHDVTKDRPLTFTFESTYESWIDEMLKLLNCLGKKRLGVFNEQVVGCEVADKYLRKRASDFQIDVALDESLSSEGRDFKTVLLKAKRGNIDSIFDCTNAGIADALIKEIREVLPGIFHTGYYANVSDLSLIEGIPYVDQLGFFDDFNQRFEKLYGVRPKYRAPHAYETIRLFSDALENTCKDTTASNIAALNTGIADFLSHVKNRPSVLGTITAGPFRNIEHPNYVKVVRNGKVMPYQ